MNSNETKITVLKTQILEAKRLQYRASQMRNARQVFKMNRELDRLYKELNALK